MDRNDLRAEWLFQAQLKLFNLNENLNSTSNQQAKYDDSATTQSNPYEVIYEWDSSKIEDETEVKKSQSS